MSGDKPARVLRFEGIHNFRDYGGYRAAGGTLRLGRLFRSAQHRDASGVDLEAIAALGLSSVIDLRSDGERATSPCPRPEGFAARIVFAPDSVGAMAPHIEAARAVDSPETAAARMVAAYAEMPFRPTFTWAIAAYFEELARVDGPTLIHCMAGKDRTGIAVAVFHIAMGVRRDEWLADYLMTNEAGNVEGRIRAGALHVRRAFGHDLDDDTVRVLMTVRPQFIDSALAAMEERAGGVLEYLAQCGVSGQTLETVRARLIV